MNKILSWKINNASYAYIFPTNGSYISNAISEDSPLWANIIGELSTWTLDTYKSNFNKMAAEVKNKFGVTIPWKDEYWGLGVDGSVGGVNIIMLSGKGGDGDGYGSGEISPEVYEEFNKMIDAELQKTREAIEKKNAEVKAFVEAKVTETISAAKQTIAETKAEIDETRNELEGKLEGATEALDKAAALFELGEGGIDGEAIKDVMNSVSAHTTWFNTYSGTVADFQTDYDLATKRLGEMTVASSVTDGLFSRFATSMNVVSGTVGNVETTANAAYGEIKQVAEWINENEESVANVSRFMSASAALIEDKIKYIDNDLTSVIERTVDGKNATIRDEIKAETANGLTNVRNEMNALSGSILQELTHYAPDSAITSIGDQMDVMSATMRTWITKTDSAMSMTHDLREEWSIESGKISTVSNLVAKTDANGEIQYWVSGETGNLIRVRKYETNPKYWMGEDGNLYEDYRVFVEYSDTLGSYIQQEVSSITLSVMGTDNMTAAIRLAVEADEKGGGEAIIGLVADKVVIDANIIAKAISAKTANIGGIMIGNGIVESMKTIGTGVFNYFSSSITESVVEFPLKTLEDNLWKFYDEYRFDEQFVYSVENEENIKHYYSAWTNSSKEEKLIFNVIKHMDGSWYSNEPLDEEIEHLIYEKNNISYISGITQEKRIYTVILSDGTWVDLNGTTYDESLVYRQEAQIPAFKLDGVQGKLISHNAEIYGDIHADSGNIGELTLKDGAIENKNFTLSSSGLVVYGSIRQPFMRFEPTLARGGSGGMEWGDLEELSMLTDGGDEEGGIELNDKAFVNQKYYDNLYIPVPVEYKDEDKRTYFPSSVSDIGRRVLLVHNKNGKQVNELSESKLYLKDGFYFFEDGFASNFLTFSNEIIELIGYGINDKGKTLVNGENGESVFYGWIVLNRKNIMTQSSYGHELRALAMGKIYVSSAAYFTDYKTFDGSTSTSKNSIPAEMWTSNSRMYFSISGDSTNKKVKVMLPSRWFNGSEITNLMIQATPLSLCTVCARPNNYGFEIETSEPNVWVNFIIYNKNDWFSLPTYVDFSFSVSKTNHNFSFYHYGASYADTIYLYPSPSNTKINVEWSGDTDYFTYSYNSSNKKLVVYPKAYNWSTIKTYKLTATITATHDKKSKTVKVNYTQSDYPDINTPT